MLANTPANEKDHVRRQPAHLAQIMRCHDHLGPRLNAGMNYVLDHAGRRRIEAGRWFVEQKDFGLARQGTCKCQSLLFATRQAARGPQRKFAQADGFEQFQHATVAQAARVAGTRKPVGNIRGSRASQHDRFLEQECAPSRPAIRPPSPAHPALRRVGQAHAQPQQRSLTRTIGTDNQSWPTQADGQAQLVQNCCRTSHQ